MAVNKKIIEVEIDGKNIAVLTDLGIACNSTIEHLKVCDAAFLESNYEHDILLSGKYPAYLKQRVASDHGHLSNSQAFELVKSLIVNDFGKAITVYKGERGYLPGAFQIKHD